MQTILNIITQVGFPICVSLMCFWYIKVIQEKHKDEISELAKAIQNNTLVMQQLVDKLGHA